MRFLPYGFGVRFTHEKGFVITSDDAEIKPKSPPSTALSTLPLPKMREEKLRRDPGDKYPGNRRH